MEGCLFSKAKCRLFEKSGRGPKNGEKYGAPFREEDWSEHTNEDGSTLLTVTDASPLAIQVSGDNLDADNEDNIFSKQDLVVENSFLPNQLIFFADQLDVPSGNSISPDDNDELGRLLFACLAAPENSSQLHHLNCMQDQMTFFPMEVQCAQ